MARRRQRSLPVLSGEPSEPAATTGAAVLRPEVEALVAETVEPGAAVPRPPDAPQVVHTAAQNRDRLAELLAARAARKQAQQLERDVHGPKPKTKE